MAAPGQADRPGPGLRPRRRPGRRHAGLRLRRRRWAALVIGLIAGVVCYGAVCLKPMLKYDDSLDAFGVHGVGGFLGAVLTGVFASAALVNAAIGRRCPADCRPTA